MKKIIILVVILIIISASAVVYNIWRNETKAACFGFLATIVGLAFYARIVTGGKSPGNDEQQW